MKAYLFGSIFYEKDIVYNKILLDGIRKVCPNIDIYAPQEASFNDKKTFGDSKAIFDGDYERLSQTDLLVGCLDGDLPPIGSVTELGIFCEMAKQDPKKTVIVLHTDSRDAYKTASLTKHYDMTHNQCASQYNYFNLFTRGAIESCGLIVGTKEQLFEAVKEYANRKDCWTKDHFTEDEEETGISAYNMYTRNCVGFVKKDIYEDPENTAAIVACLQGKRYYYKGYIYSLIHQDKIAANFLDTNKAQYENWRAKL